jgi:nicotinamide mononucleotide adenylyltransferase
MKMKILFLGRMHILTKFQKDSLIQIKNKYPKKFDEVVAVISSANFKETKRNPLSVERRIEQLNSFLQSIGIPYEIFYVNDINNSEKWVEYVEKQIA